MPERTEAPRSLLAQALAAVDARGDEALRRLLGRQLPARPARKRQVPKLGDPIRPTPHNPLLPLGWEWFYARWCALECLHLWDPPQIVLDYLETGDPHLATVGEAEALLRPNQMRETAAGAAARCSAFTGPEGPPVGSPGRAAAWSAYYSAIGNIAGAAEKAIHALALHATRAAAPSREEHLEVYRAAQAKLQVVFARAAAEIEAGDRTL